MNSSVLYRTVWESFEVYENSFHEYIIRGASVNGEQCLIEQRESNKWLLTFNGVYKFILNTKTLVKMLKNANVIIM